MWKGSGDILVIRPPMKLAVGMLRLHYMYCTTVALLVIKLNLATFLLYLLLLIYTIFSLIYGFYFVFTEKKEIGKLKKKCRKWQKSDWVSDLPKSLPKSSRNRKLKTGLIHRKRSGQRSAQITAPITLTAGIDSRSGKRAENPNSKKRSPNPLQTPQDQSQEPRPSLREFHSQSNTKSKEESKTIKKTKSNWDFKTLIKLELRFSSYKRAASKPANYLFFIISSSAILQKNTAAFLLLFFLLPFVILSTMSG